MTKILTLGTMNIQNKYRIKKYDGRESIQKDNVEVIADILETNKIDAIGTQELVRSYIKRIKKRLKTSKYVSTGGYYYGSNGLIMKIGLLEKFNESTTIFTTKKILKAKTIMLPWTPKNFEELIDGIKSLSIRPRSLTVALLLDEDLGFFYYVNTHIVFGLESIQRRQLNKVISIIEELEYPAVLTGDFNVSYDKAVFKEFIENVEKHNMQRIQINQRTFIYEKEDIPIDHIFIPKEWKVIDAHIIDDERLNNFSDHYPLVVKIDKDQTLQSNLQNNSNMI